MRRTDLCTWCWHDTGVPCRDTNMAGLSPLLTTAKMIQMGPDHFAALSRNSLAFLMSMHGNARLREELLNGKTIPNLAS